MCKYMFLKNYVLYDDVPVHISNTIRICLNWTLSTAYKYYASTFYVGKLLLYKMFTFVTIYNFCCVQTAKVVNNTMEIIF